MSTKRSAAKVASILALCGGAVMIASNACDPTSCNEAKQKMQASIDHVCDSEDAYKDNPLCACCRAAGLYSIDDTCTCKTLVFNTDFCFFEEHSGGYSSIRTALEHAASVCENRAVNKRYAEAGSFTCLGLDGGAPDAAEEAAPSDAGDAAPDDAEPADAAADG